MSLRTLFLLCGAAFLCQSCRQGTGTSSSATNENTPLSRVYPESLGGKEIPLHYARCLTMTEHDGLTEAFLLNPQDTTEVLLRFVIENPLHRIVVCSSIHCALLEELGCAGAIAGVCDAQYNRLPFVQKGLQEGTIMNAGNSMEPNIERILELHPDAFLPSSLDLTVLSARLNPLGIPLLPCADYMESSPLARAEWMRFYGRIIGQGEKADSLFREVERRYLSLREKLRATEHHPRLVSEMPFSGKWHVPRGQSYAANLYRDAGADYVFADLEGTGSAALSIETALDKALTAEVWLIRSFGTLSRNSLYHDTPGLQQMQAKLWVCDTSQKLYFERTSFHPDEALAELAHILYPQRQTESSGKYFSLLEE